MVIKQSSAFTDHLEEAATTVIVFLVNFEVACELGKLLGKESNLNLWTASVALLDSELFDDLRFGVCF